MNSQQRNLEIIDNYRKTTGTENRVLSFNDLPPPAPDNIDVMEFPPFKEDYDWVYATVGASAKPMPDPQGTAQLPSGRRMELMLHSMRKHEGLADLLLALAVYPFEHNIFFSPGDIVAGTPGQGVVEGSPLTEILLTHPYTYPDPSGAIHHSEGSHTHILWVIPIYYAERLYAREHGFRALEAQFGNKQATTSDFWRPPVV
jgi:hypothetical protein